MIQLEDGDVVNDKNSSIIVEERMAEEMNLEEAKITHVDHSHEGPRKRGNLYFALMSTFWFGICQALIALVVVIWPSQIALIVGESSKELYNGLLPALGSLIAFAMTPIAGVLSDYNFFGAYKRRLFMLSGTVIAIVFLFVCATFSSPSSNIWLLGLFIFGAHFGLSWCSGPYAGVVLDSVVHSQLGLVSGWQGMAAGIGDLVGAIGAGLLLQYSYMSAYGLVIALLGISLVPTLFAIREPVEPRKPLTLNAFIQEFKLPADVYRNFYWVIASRFLFEMGLAEILVYIQYYLADIIHAENPALMAAIVVAIGIAVGIPTSMFAGPVSDAVGRKPIVYMSSCIMSLAAFIYLLLSITPNIYGVFVVSVIFGIGYGAYKSVDWALALEVIPQTAAGKDMGIWQAFMVVPKIVSPLIAGAILHATGGSANGYMIIFALGVVYFVGATVCIIPVHITPKSTEVTLEGPELFTGVSVDVASPIAPPSIYDIPAPPSKDLYYKFNCVKQPTRADKYSTGIPVL